MRRRQPDISIVIPALNEEKRVGHTLDELAAFLRRDPLFRTLQTEVVVVSADSADKTHRIVAAKGRKFNDFLFLKPGARVGKGRDVRYGMLRAHGKAILFMDADLSTPLYHLAEFYELYRQGADVVIGTRDLRKHHSKVLRRAIANGGNLLFRFAGGMWVEDSQCGFKLFTGRAADICFSRLTIQAWGFDMEVLAIARAHRLTIMARRIDDWQDQPHSKFDAEGVMRNSLHSLRDLMYIARRRVARYYTRPE